MRKTLKLHPHLSNHIVLCFLGFFVLFMPATTESDILNLEKKSVLTNIEVKGGTSIYGNYLAGRHAQTIKDTSSATVYFQKALTLSPGNKDLLQRTFLVMMSEGNFTESIPLAHKVLSKEPKSAIANLAVIIDHISTERFNEAMEKITSLHAGGLNGYMAPLLAAWTSQAQNKNLEEVFDHLQPLNQKGSAPLYYLHKALLFDINGDQESAINAYLKGIKEQDGIILRVAQLLGNLYERTGNTERAKALYTEFSKANPNSPFARKALKNMNSSKIPKPIIKSAKEGAAESFFGIATSLSQQNAQETALIFSRMGLHIRRDFPVMQILLGSLLQSNGQLQAANKVLLGINPSSPFSWPARLSAAENLDELEQTDEAAETLNKMANEEPKLASPLVRLGDILRKRERFAEARQAYDKAFKRIDKLQPHHWSLLYARGIVLERTKQWNKAEADFLKALDFNPNQPFVLNYLGYSWVDQGKHLDRAKEMIQRAVNLRPNDGYIVDSLGWAYYMLGEYNNSIKEMERAVELRPEDPVLNDHLGDALWRVGRKLEAKYQWKRVLTLKPEKKLSTQVKQKLIDGLPNIAKKNN